MTTTSLPSTATSARSPERDLRLLLGADAVVTGGGGVLAVVDAAWVADLLGVDARGWVRAVGAFLLVLALDLALTARSSTGSLRRWTPVFAAGDFAWVAATAVLLALGAFSGAGIAIAAVAGLVVLEVGITKLRFRNRL